MKLEDKLAEEVDNEAVDANSANVESENENCDAAELDRAAVADRPVDTANDENNGPCSEAVELVVADNAENASDDRDVPRDVDCAIAAVDDDRATDERKFESENANRKRDQREEKKRRQNLQRSEAMTGVALDSNRRLRKSAIASRPLENFSARTAG